MGATDVVASIPPRPSFRRWVRVLVGVVVAIAIALALRTVGVEQLMDAMAEARGPWMMAAAIAYATTLPLWALEWQVLASLGRGRFRQMLAVTSVTSTAYCTTLSLGGEVAAVAMLVSRAGLTRAAAMAVVVMDHVLVGVAKCAVIAAAALTAPLPTWVRAGVATLCAGLLALAIAALTTAWSSTAQRSWVGRVMSARAIGFIDRLHDGMASFRSRRRSVAALGLAVAKLGCEIVAVICVQRAFGVDLPLSAALLNVAALTLTTIIPLVPGNLGVFEATVVAVYAGFGVPVEQATAMAIGQHGVYLSALALPGLGWLLRDLRR
jgi:uncharacterized protein (TIRG00374 family)